MLAISPLSPVLGADGWAVAPFGVWHWSCTCASVLRHYVLDNILTALNSLICQSVSSLQPAFSPICVFCYSKKKYVEHFQNSNTSIVFINIYIYTVAVVSIIKQCVLAELAMTGGFLHFLSVGFRGKRLQTTEGKQERIFCTCPGTGCRQENLAKRKGRKEWQDEEERS